MSLDVATSFNTSSQNASRAFFGEFDLARKSSQTLSQQGSLFSLSHTSYIKLFQLFSKFFSQLYICERDVFIGEEEEVGIPEMVERRPYPLGGFSKLGNKKPNEDVRCYLVEQLMLTPLMKWLAMETSLLFEIFFQKQLGAGSPPRESTNGHGDQC